MDQVASVLASMLLLKKMSYLEVQMHQISAQELEVGIKKVAEIVA